MLASIIEGMRDDMQKGFADIAVFKQLVVENMPKLIAKTAGKADGEDVKLTSVEVSLAVSSTQNPNIVSPANVCYPSHNLRAGRLLHFSALLQNVLRSKKTAKRQPGSSWTSTPTQPPRRSRRSSRPC